MEVNEQGTEAAGATKVELRVGSAEPTKEPFRFTADRPFFFTIEDQETGLILFMGTLKEPKE
ncbi:Serpin (serine protease inhibitor) [compost metagenome]